MLCRGRGPSVASRRTAHPGLARGTLPLVRACIRFAYGGPDVLTVADVPDPVPRAGDLLVRVRATTVSRTDCGILTGEPFPIRFFTGLRAPSSPVPGTDFAGEVVGVGAGVTGFQVGDRVMGFNDTGLASQAQLLRIPADSPLAVIPHGVSDAEAAACMEGAHYAMGFLRRSRYRPGQRVCVYGASGAIGSAAVQLVHGRGSHVTAFCPAEHADRVRALGADVVVDSTTSDVSTYPESFDRVFDAVGKSSFFACRPILAEGGHYVSSELGPRAQNAYLPLLTRLSSGPLVDFPIPSGIAYTLQVVARLLATGRFRPLIDRHVAMDEVRAAYEYVLQGTKVGNVILDIP